MNTLGLIAAAERHADRIAIEEADGASITYRELFARAHRRARTLARGDVVEVPAVRSADFVAGCLGAWLAGTAWLPVNPLDPRRSEIVARARRARGAPDLAYVIATSGSTGAPKLVMVSHRGIPGLVRTQIDAFALGPGARSLWLHAPVFDASLSDWATALVAGATLVVPQLGDLRGELARREITHVDLPTALLAEIAAAPPPSLRVVVLGGDACPPEWVRELARRTRVVVVYGPTEATVCSSLVVVDPATWTRPLIGAPLPGVRYRVEDGELWIAGDALAIGYAGDPGETARSFVVSGGERWYRTGDRVSSSLSGLVFVGRLDRQRKLAGGRVELDGVEAVLRRVPGVRDAACAVRASSRGRPRLIAFVEGDVDGKAVRAFARGELPDWMVPARVVVGRLPRTGTGKVDHTALASCELPERRAHRADALEAELAALWCDALGTDDARGDERFGEAGGDSLARLTLLAAADAHGLSLGDDVLASNPTFDELVACVRARAATATLSVEACETRGLDELARAEHVARRPGGGPRDTVLVTGATGRLGGALLRAWRARDDRRLLALVRQHDDATARLRSLGVDAVCGDLAQPRLGLSRDALDALGPRLAAIVHVGATIQLGHGWDAHAPVNVAGTAALARLAGDEVAFHHVSTLSVFTETDRAEGRHDERAAPDPGALAYGGYAQTKVAAEAIARALRGRRAVTTVFRLGLLVTDSPRDQLAMTVRGLARVGAVPAGARALRLDTTPVAHAAAAIATLALAAERGRHDDVHHISSLEGSTLGDLAEALRVAGRELLEVPPGAWADRARGLIADPDVAMAYLSLGRAHGERARFRGFDLFQATGADFAVERTTQLIGAPRPVDLGALVADAVEAS